MCEYCFRDATRDDLPEVVKLCEEHASYEKADYESRGKVAKLDALLFAKKAEVKVVVAELFGQPNGFASYTVQYSTWRADKYLYLDCLYLRPLCRGQGIGKALMAEIETRARQMDCAEIQWQTPSTNQSAIEFYDRLPQATRSAKYRFTQNLILPVAESATGTDFSQENHS